MFSIDTGAGFAPAQIDDYYITYTENGQNTLSFVCAKKDNIRKYIDTEVHIKEGTSSGQYFVIKELDGDDDLSVVAYLNLRDWQVNVYVDYSKKATIAEHIAAWLPDGWTILSNASKTEKVEVAFSGNGLDGMNALLAATEDIGIKYDNVRKVITVVDTDKNKATAYFTYERNLRKLSIKKKSTDTYTRLYARGKDGLSFADINDGKDYVECHTYSQDIISQFWSDERYTIAENLLAAAQAIVNAAAKPEASYECDVMDLYKTNPQEFAHQKVEILKNVRVIGENTDFEAIVSEYKDYPHYPEKNTVTLASVLAKIGDNVSSTSKAVTTLQSQVSTLEENANIYLSNVKYISATQLSATAMNPTDGSEVTNIWNITTDASGNEVWTNAVNNQVIKFEGFSS